MLVSLFLGLAVISLAGAQNPPQPDFFWPYGTVLLGDENIQPAQQPVIGLVNGKACGETTTFIATDAQGVPEGDVGKTVYVVDILADGTGDGHRPGCGTPGAPVTLYFPESRRLSQQTTAFTIGGQRVDVSLGPELIHRLQGPMLASDGTN